MLTGRPAPGGSPLFPSFFLNQYNHIMDTHDNPGSLSGIGQILSKYLKLLIEDTRLNVAEKLTRLLATIALASLLTITVTVALVFVSIAVGIALAQSLSPLWSFVIVAGFYIVLLIVLVACRKALLLNPIARFISSILLPAPSQNETGHDQSTPVS